LIFFHKISRGFQSIHKIRQLSATINLSQILKKEFRIFFINIIKINFLKEKNIKKYGHLILGYVI